jgi:hypothetical protein
LSKKKQTNSNIFKKSELNQQMIRIDAKKTPTQKDPPFSLIKKAPNSRSLKVN